MFDAYQEHCDYNYATETEIDNAEASELSYFNTDQAWVLTDRDVWHENPYYKGDPVPHPESGIESEKEYDEWVRLEKARLKAIEDAPAYVYVYEPMKNDVPF